jgi:hypothetical protein
MGLGRRSAHQGILLFQKDLRFVSGRESISTPPVEATAKIQVFFVDRLRTQMAIFAMALFELISTRSVSEGWIYVACDALPHSSLAHASGCEKPVKTSIHRPGGTKIATSKLTFRVEIVPKSQTSKPARRPTANRPITIRRSSGFPRGYPLPSLVRTPGQSLHRDHPISKPSKPCESPIWTASVVSRGTCASDPSSTQVRIQIGFSAGSLAWIFSPQWISFRSQSKGSVGWPCGSSIRSNIPIER